MWKETEYGALPFTGFTHNVKLITNPKEAKAQKDTKFEPESYFDEKIYTPVTKFQPKTTVYSLTHNGYATIVKADETNNTYLCRLRVESGQDSNNESKEVTVKAEELTRLIKV
jgi:hypothetical protein